MLTYSKSTMHVLRMLMHWSLRCEFQLLKFFPNQTYGTMWTHVGLCPKFLVVRFFTIAYEVQTAICVSVVLLLYKTFQPFWMKKDWKYVRCCTTVLILLL